VNGTSFLLTVFSVCGEIITSFPVENISGGLFFNRHGVFFQSYESFWRIVDENGTPKLEMCPSSVPFSVASFAIDEENVWNSFCFNSKAFVVGLSKRGRLAIRDSVTQGVTSFVLHKKHVLFTTSTHLHAVDISNGYSCSHT
jgi:hypothetical protein